MTFTSKREAFDFINTEVLSAADPLADNIFKHIALTIDEQLTKALDETLDADTDIYSFVAPALNQIVYRRLADHCYLASSGWLQATNTELNYHFPE